jgi:hypothetical protein
MPSDLEALRERRREAILEAVGGREPMRTQGQLINLRGVLKRAVEEPAPRIPPSWGKDLEVGLEFWQVLRA